MDNKVEVKFVVWANWRDWKQACDYSICDNPNLDMTSHGWYKVGEYSVTVPAVTKERIAPIFVAGAEATIKEIRLTAERKIAEIENNLQAFLAIEHKGDSDVPV